MSGTNTPAITRFISVAQEFMTWVDGSTPLTPQDMLALHWLLARLQVALIELPAVVAEDLSTALEVKSSSGGDRFISLTNQLKVIGLNRYRKVLFPLDDDGELLEGSLADDLTDIYRDLNSGLAHASDLNFTEAVWEWRFGYFEHWGYHLADAQTALRQYLQQNAAPWFDPPC